MSFAGRLQLQLQLHERLLCKLFCVSISWNMVLKIKSCNARVSQSSEVLANFGFINQMQNVSVFLICRIWHKILLQRSTRQDFCQTIGLLALAGFKHSLDRRRVYAGSMAHVTSIVKTIRKWS